MQKMIFFLGFFALAFISTISTGVYSKPQSEEITIQPIISNESSILVEIIEAKCQAKPRSLESCSCQIRNGSDKDVTALAITWTVTWSNGHIDKWYQRMDTLVREGLRPVSPNREISLQSSGSVFATGDESIKQVQVSVDYVEFSDKSSLGSDASGASRHIALTRQGGKVYKDWLARVYQEQGQDLVIAKLLGDEFPEALKDSPAKEGAMIYKMWLLDVYKKQGSAAAIEKLTQN